VAPLWYTFAIVGRIGANGFQRLGLLLSLVNHQARSILFGVIGRRDSQSPDQAQRVDHDESLAADCLLASVVAGSPAAGGCFDRLRVDDADGRLGLFPDALPNLIDQMGLQPLQGSVVASAGIPAVHSSPMWEIVRQQPPLTTRLLKVENGVQNRPQIGSGATTACRLQRQMFLTNSH